MTHPTCNGCGATIPTAMATCQTCDTPNHPDDLERDALAMAAELGKLRGRMETIERLATTAINERQDRRWLVEQIRLIARGQYA